MSGLYYRLLEGEERREEGTEQVIEDLEEDLEEIGGFGVEFCGKGV